MSKCSNLLRIMNESISDSAKNSFDDFVNYVYDEYKDNDEIDYDEAAEMIAEFSNRIKGEMRSKDLSVVYMSEVTDDNFEKFIKDSKVVRRMNSDLYNIEVLSNGDTKMISLSDGTFPAQIVIKNSDLSRFLK